MKTIRRRLLGAFLLPPIVAAGAVALVAVMQFRADKERSFQQVMAQSVELLGGILDARLALLARSSADPAPPPGRAPAPARRLRLTNQSEGGEARLRLEIDGPKGSRRVTFAPAELLDPARLQGPTDLMVVNTAGEILLHTDPRRVQGRESLSALVEELSLFSPRRPRIGVRKVELHGRPHLVAFARGDHGLAVLQAMPVASVFAATEPFVLRAVLAALAAAGLSLLLSLLLARRLTRPLRAMSAQAEAIGRGDYDVEVACPEEAEVAQLARALNTLSRALKEREQQLEAARQRLVHAEALNTAARVVSAVSEQVSEPLERTLATLEKLQRLVPPGSSEARKLERVVRDQNRGLNALQSLRRIPLERGGEPEAIDVETLLGDVRVSAAPVLSAAELDLELSGPPRPCQVVAIRHEAHNALLDVLLHISQRALTGSLVELGVGVSAEEVRLTFAYPGDGQEASAGGGPGALARISHLHRREAVESAVDSRPSHRRPPQSHLRCVEDGRREKAAKMRCYPPPQQMAGEKSGLDELTLELSVAAAMVKHQGGHLERGSEGPNQVVSLSLPGGPKAPEPPPVPRDPRPDDEDNERSKRPTRPVPPVT